MPASRPASRIVRIRVALVALTLGTLTALGLVTGTARGQVAGENVNMVSGTEWPGGDPFLQRQNEPSVAVSSRNRLHLLAGANDYRTVDLPGLPGEGETGDAWLGVFKSFDGGLTWESTLLPGYPQDNSPEGLASPIKGLAAAADPVVRAGTHGLFYYLGIAFNREMDLGRVFVARYIDLNNKENGSVAAKRDSIQYTGAFTLDSGNAGQFLDKPWIAVGKPDEDSATCTIPSDPVQEIAAGPVYAAWAMFTGTSNTSSKIMFSRSLDCGSTWSHPIKLSESNTLNQGVTLAVDPTNGDVYVAWRRFQTSSNSNAIVYTRSTNGGETFPKADEVADEIIPFDQASTPTSIRTQTMPTMAVSVDADGTSRAHVAWAERQGVWGESRIMMSTSSPNGRNWSTPFAVDPDPIVDDMGNVFSVGHQLMPAMTFGAGRLLVLYYETRLDHTVGQFYPNEPFVPDEQGRFYREERSPRGELPGSPELVFTPFLDDFGLTERRHTIDLRVAQADPAADPDFVATMVSRYPFGTRGDEKGTIEYLQQLQVNPPNFPLFAQGTLSFFGDYVDIGGPTFFRDPTTGAWDFDTARAVAPVFHATWTSNQDVRPPADGDWSNYTPVGGGGASTADPASSTPACVSGQEGMRNQNVYTSRITQGLLVSSPQNTKPLSTDLVRAFVVTAQNLTDEKRVFRFTIPDQPVDGKASFLQFPEPGDPDPMISLDLVIGPYSGISRAVFVTSSDPVAKFQVVATEIDAVGGNPLIDGLQSGVQFNPDPSAPTLINPDGVTDPASDIALVEVFTPNITAPNITNPNITNTAAANPNITNPNITNPNITNPNITNADIANLGITNPNITNPNITNPNITNPNITNPNITNTAVSDATYTVSNDGNTSSSYRVKLVGDEQDAELQMIVSKMYMTPVALNCALQQESHNVVLANIPDALIEPPGGLTDPNIPEPALDNATFALRPGEVAFVTLRGVVALDEMAAITTRVAPAIIPHPANTDEIDPDFDVLLLITTSALPEGTFGEEYKATLEVLGAQGATLWTIIDGDLPDGLTLDPTTGEISGTLAEAGVFELTFEVTDSASPPQSAQRAQTLIVNRLGTTTSLGSAPNPSTFGQSVELTATVSGTDGSPTGTVVFKDGGLEIGSAPLIEGSAGFSTASLAVGAHALTAVYQQSAEFETSASAVVDQQVDAADTTTTLVSSENPVALPRDVTFMATVSVISPGAGNPGGSVIFREGGFELGRVELLGGSASLTVSSSDLGVGEHPVVASYEGDDSFNGSDSEVVVQVVNQAVSTTALASSVNPSVAGQPVTFTATVAAVTEGSGQPSGVVTFTDGATTIGMAKLSGPTASITVAILSVGEHPITASYSGDAMFVGSSDSLDQVVDVAATTTSLVSSVNPSAFGQEVTFTATLAVVPPGAGSPTGTLTFFDGETELGSAPVLDGGASLSTTELAVGSHPITATYGGDGSFAPASSPTLTQTVDTVSTITMLSSSANPSIVGQPVVFTATVMSAIASVGPPTGAVTFEIDGAARDTVELVEGMAEYTTSQFGTSNLDPGLGDHLVVARYQAEGGFESSVSPDLTQSVQYDFTGYLPPLATAGSLADPGSSGSAALGSIVPVSWQIQLGNGIFVGNTSTVARLEAIRNADCAGPPEGSTVVLVSPEGGVAEGSQFGYLGEEQRFLFSWDTSIGVDAGPGCYSLVLELIDGSVRATVLELTGAVTGKRAAELPGSMFTEGQSAVEPPRP